MELNDNKKVALAVIVISSCCLVFFGSYATYLIFGQLGVTPAVLFAVAYTLAAGGGMYWGAIR